MLVTLLVVTTALAQCSAQNAQEVFPFREFLDCMAIVLCTKEENLKMREMFYNFPPDTMNEIYENSTRIFNWNAAPTEDHYQVDIIKKCEEEDKDTLKVKLETQFQGISEYIMERCMPPQIQFASLCQKLEPTVEDLTALMAENIAKGNCEETANFKRDPSIPSAPGLG